MKINRPGYMHAKIANNALYINYVRGHWLNILLFSLISPQSESILSQFRWYG